MKEIYFNSKGILHTGIKFILCWFIVFNRKKILNTSFSRPSKSFSVFPSAKAAMATSNSS